MGGNNNLQGDNKRLFWLYLLQNQHGLQQTCNTITEAL